MRPSLKLANRKIVIKNDDKNEISISYRNEFGKIYYWIKRNEEEGIEVSENNLYGLLSWFIDQKM